MIDLKQVNRTPRQVLTRSLSKDSFAETKGKLGGESDLLGSGGDEVESPKQPFNEFEDKGLQVDVEEFVDEQKQTRRNSVALSEPLSDSTVRQLERAGSSNNLGPLLDDLPKHQPVKSVGKKPSSALRSLVNSPKFKLAGGMLGMLAGAALVVTGAQKIMEKEGTGLAEGTQPTRPALAQLLEDLSVLEIDLRTLDIIQRYLHGTL